MNADPPGTAAGDPPRSRWWLDPALARLAFGSVPARRVTPGTTDVAAHLAFLPPESLELDLNDPAQRSFGDYELLEVIGQGGMGLVYRAHQLSLDREVALKLLSAGPWASEEFIAGFKREAQSAALLQHPNIVAVHAMGEHEGLIYYAMELVRGKSLAQHLDEKKALPPREAAALLRMVAEAVDYAHRLGVLHLDLKPGNILLDANGTPKVADFGLARRLGQALSLENEQVSGTPSYMAPEQARIRSAKLSPATDVWGLGAILYEALTGEPPFAAATPQDTLRLVLDGQVRSPGRTARVPRDLEAICLKCLTKDAGERYSSARALADDLGRYREGRAVTVRPLNAWQRSGRWARREPLLAATAAAAFAALLAGIVATSLQKQRADRNAATASERLWESRRETALRQQLDGSGYEALPRMLANITEQERAGKVDSASIDRLRLGMLLAQGARLIDEMRITDANPLAAGLSPDGSVLALALTDYSVRWYDSATLSERGRVDLMGLPNSGDDMRLPMLLRFVDNHRLRVTLDWMQDLVAPPGSDTHLIDLDRGAVVEPSTEFADLADVTYSADGDHALLRDHAGGTQLWQVSPWKPLGRRVVIPQRTQPWLLGRGARFAALFDASQNTLRSYDPHDLAKPRRIALPSGRPLSSWTKSGDGHWLALGDHSGNVYLFDARTQQTRTLLRANDGKRIVSLSFSEDDAWLAASNLHGVLYAFDVASGNTLSSTEMRVDFNPQWVGISRAQRWLFAQGGSSSSFWRLPEYAPQVPSAQRFASGPSRTVNAGDYGMGWSSATGLLVSSNMSGQVRLWRLPAQAQLDAMAPPWRAESLRFDGQRVVDVEWNRLRLASVTDAPATDWIELPQPPLFAELVDGGRMLIVIAGRELRVFDVPELRLRRPPLVLDETPVRLELSRDGTLAVLAFGDSTPAGYSTRLETWDLRRGHRLAGATNPGALRLLQLSADGSRVLANHGRHDSTVVYATRGLREIGRHRHDPDAPVIAASFGKTRDTVLLAVRADDPREKRDAVLAWEPVRNRILERWNGGESLPIGVASAGGRVYLCGRNRGVLDPDQPRGQVIEWPVNRAEPVAVFATSHDGRVVAQAFRDMVQLYDVADGGRIGPPLYPGTPGGDQLVALAFAPDDTSLLARSQEGRWYRWPTPIDQRPVAQLQRDVEWLVVRPDLHAHNIMGPWDGVAGPLPVLTQAERRRLRATDPGPWRVTPPRPTIAATRRIDGVPVPARDPGANALQLDLSPHCNLAADARVDPMIHALGDIRAQPHGVIRVDGIDYDLRCAVRLHGSSASRDPETSNPQRATGIAVPAQPIAAFHLLLDAPLPDPIPEEQLYARLRVHYRDGGSAVLPLRIQRELPGFSAADRPVPVAWIRSDRTVTLLALPEQFPVSNPRLPNPYPMRLIDRLDIEALPQPWSRPTVLAITAEPVTASQTTSLDVIAAAAFRNQQQEHDQATTRASR